MLNHAHHLQRDVIFHDCCLLVPGSKTNCSRSPGCCFSTEELYLIQNEFPRRKDGGQQQLHSQSLNRTNSCLLRPYILCVCVCVAAVSSKSEVWLKFADWLHLQGSNVAFPSWPARSPSKGLGGRAVHIPEPSYIRRDLERSGSKYLANLLNCYLWKELGIQSQKMRVGVLDPSTY